MDPCLWPIVAARLAADDPPVPAQAPVREPSSALAARLVGLIFDDHRAVRGASGFAVTHKRKREGAMRPKAPI